MRLLTYEESQTDGPVLAIFSIYSDKLRCTFRNLKLMRSKKGSLFVSFPSVAKDSADGKKTWSLNCEFDGDLQKQFATDIMNLIKDKTAGLNGNL